MRKTTIYLSGTDYQKIEKIKEWYGLSSLSSVLRFLVIKEYNFVIEEKARLETGMFEKQMAALEMVKLELDGLRQFGNEEVSCNETK